MQINSLPKDEKIMKYNYFQSALGFNFYLKCSLSALSPSPLSLHHFLAPQLKGTGRFLCKWSFISFGMQCILNSSLWIWIWKDDTRSEEKTFSFEIQAYGWLQILLWLVHFFIFNCVCVVAICFSSEWGCMESRDFPGTCPIEHFNEHRWMGYRLIQWT